MHLTAVDQSYLGNNASALDMDSPSSLWLTAQYMTVNTPPYCGRHHKEPRACVEWTREYRWSMLRSHDPLCKRLSICAFCYLHGISLPQNLTVHWISQESPGKKKILFSMYLRRGLAVLTPSSQSSEQWLLHRTLAILHYLNPE